jgi:hypothetical protein
MISEGATAIQPAPESIFDITGAERKIRDWELVKKKVLGPGDTLRVGGNMYIKRSGWRKLALAANVATSIVEVKSEYEGAWTPENQEGDFTATVKAKAHSSWGRWAEDLGVYSASEFVQSGTKKRLPISRHNVIARAATRAINRAVSDLIGGGIVSAEEVAPDVPEEAAPGPGGPAGPRAVTKEEVEYAVREFGESVSVTETLDEVRVVLTGGFSQDEFSQLKQKLAEVGGVFVLKSGEKSYFSVKK